MNAWRVLRVSTGSEKDVAARIMGDGIEVRLPTFLERKRSRGRRRGATTSCEHPMFPGYLFADFSEAQSTPEAYARGLSVGRSRVAVIPGKSLSDAQIGAVMATAFKLSSVSDRTVIHEGAFVDIWHGIMKGERAEVLRLRGERAVISLLGSKQVLLVDTTDLESVRKVAAHG